MGRSWGSVGGGEGSSKKVDSRKVDGHDIFKSYLSPGFPYLVMVFSIFSSSFHQPLVRFASSSLSSFPQVAHFQVTYIAQLRKIRTKGGKSKSKGTRIPTSIAAAGRQGTFSK